MSNVAVYSGAGMGSRKTNTCLGGGTILDGYVIHGVGTRTDGGDTMGKTNMFISNTNLIGDYLVRGYAGRGSSSGNSSCNNNVGVRKGGDIVDGSIVQGGRMISNGGTFNNNVFLGGDTITRGYIVCGGSSIFHNNNICVRANNKGLVGAAMMGGVKTGTNNNIFSGKGSAACGSMF